MVWIGAISRLQDFLLATQVLCSAHSTHSPGSRMRQSEFRPSPSAAPHLIHAEVGPRRTGVLLGELAHELEVLRICNRGAQGMPASGLIDGPALAPARFDALASASP